MGPLSLDFALPLRSFELALALDVETETVALVGPSRAGKTTVLGATLGNRSRVRLRLLTAEITTASLERLRLQPGDRIVASFKATQTRLLS